MLTFVGLLIILTIVVLLIWGKASTIVAMVMVPLIGALIAGFGINDIQTFFEQGIIKVLPVATMFIFAILFFGILQDTGFFEPVIKTLIKLTKGNVSPSYPTVGVRWGPGCLKVPYKIWTSQCKQPFV